MARLGFAHQGHGQNGRMSEDERLLHEAERSLEETEKMRDSEQAEGEPWAKTSSGDADSVTTDDEDDEQQGSEAPL
jgi:hypothetical protein